MEYLAQEGVFFILGPVYNNQAQTTYFEYIIPKKFISKVFRGNPTLRVKFKKQVIKRCKTFKNVRETVRSGQERSGEKTIILYKINGLKRSKNHVDY